MMNKSIFNSLPFPQDIDSLKKELDLMHNQFGKVHNEFDNMSTTKPSKVRTLNQNKEGITTDLKRLLDVALKEYKYKLELENKMLNSKIA